MARVNDMKTIEKIIGILIPVLKCNIRIQLIPKPYWFWRTTIEDTYFRGVGDEPLFDVYGGGPFFQYHYYV
jgi:hypothetical protein